MYESFYRLNAAPFQLAPDPNFFFSGGTHRRGLANLRYAVHHGDELIVICGNAGVGKTELMLRFANELDAAQHSIAQLSLSHLQPGNLLNAIAVGFGIITSGLDNDTLLKKIQRHLVARVNDGKQFLVLIDNAHCASLGALLDIAALNALNIENSGLLQIVLFGEASILDRLSQLEAAGVLKVASHFYLETLNEFETQHYIEHRLLQAGWQGDPKFSSLAYEIIYELSAGVPRQINLLCNRVLVRGYLDETHEVDENLVRIFEMGEQGENIQAQASAGYTNVISLAGMQESNIQGSRFGTRSFTHDSHDNAVNLNKDIPTVTHSENREVSMDQLLDHEEEEPSVSVEEVQDALKDFYDASDVAAVANDGLVHSMRAKLNASLRQRSIYAMRDDDNNRDGLLDKGLRSLAGMYETSSGAYHVSRFSPNDKVSVEPSTASDTKTAQNKNKIDLSDDDDDIPVDQMPPIAPPSYSTYRSGRTPMQIAVTASVFTSLLIAAVMWIASDEPVESTLGENESIVKADSKPINPFMSTTNSPFANPDDIAKVRQNLQLATMDAQTPEQAQTPESASVDSVLYDILENDTDGETASAAVIETPTVVQNTAQHAVPAQQAKKQVETKTTMNKPVPTQAVTNTVATSSTRIKPPATPTPKLVDPKKVDVKHIAIATTAPSTQTKSTLSIISDAQAGVQTTAPPKNDIKREPAKLAAVKPAATLPANPYKAVAKDELSSLLQTFSSAYEKGNIKQLVSVLSSNIKSNEANSLQQMEKDFQALFNITDMRRLTISGVHWSESNNEMMGHGRFQIKVREKGESRVSVYNGLISLNVEKSSTGALIKRLDYHYQ